MPTMCMGAFGGKKGVDQGITPPPPPVFFFFFLFTTLDEINFKISPLVLAAPSNVEPVLTSELTKCSLATLEGCQHSNSFES